MNPRSLIGMTQAARKRAAERLADGALALSLQKAVEQGAPLADPQTVRKAARGIYRVGERLRPCWGCRGCLPPCRRCDQGDKPAACTCYRFCEIRPCEGSGVQPIGVRS